MMLILNILLFCNILHLCLTLATTRTPNVDKPVPIKLVDAVVGGNAELPCDIMPADPIDEVYLVLWYKDSAGKPLYSFDVRSRNPNDALHWSDENFFGNRAHFKIRSDPTVLLITKVKLEEEGVYRCRVDYKNSPTRNQKVNLTVVVPPSTPRIWSKDKKLEASSIISGVYDEGEPLDLRCSSVGGRPLPSVTWWLDGALVDSKYFTEAPDTVVNKLNHLRAERKFDGSTLECRASNNNATQPQIKTLEMKINLKPEKVEILDKPLSVTVGREYKLVCQAVGSKPPPIFTWYHGRKVVDSNKIVASIQDGALISTSTYTITPDQQDDKREISCKAENPKIKSKSVEDTMTLSVMYSPSVQLRLGPSIQPNEIKEGDDVYFECNAHSNPAVTKLEWMHEDKVLFHKVDSGIILSNFSLVIQNVRKDHSGSYVCVATNSLGNGTSNKVNLNVLYRPTCNNHLNRKVYGVAPGGNTAIYCHLDSNPPIESFRWWFSSSGKSTEILQTKVAKVGSSSFSMLNFTAESEMDFGRVSCLGYNKIGGQMRPCTFSISPASHPLAPDNCTLKEDSTTSTLLVLCTPSYDGGIKQSFNLEIYDSLTHKFRLNLTSTNRPEFNLANLHNEQPLQFEIYAWNQIGPSEKVVIGNVKVNSPAKQTSKNNGAPNEIMNLESGSLDYQLMTSSSFLFWIGALISVLVILVVFTVIIVKKKEILTLQMLNCKNTCNMNSSTSTDNPITDSVPSAEATPRQKLKDSDPLWPDIEWSHGASSSSTRGVTFKDGSQQANRHTNFEDKCEVDVRLHGTNSVPSHIISPPPYHSFDGRGGSRYPVNYYQNPMDQEYIGWVQGSLTLDRGYGADCGTFNQRGSTSPAMTYNTQPRRNV